MSFNFNNEIRNPVGNLTMRPVRGILKSSRSMDDSRYDHNPTLITTAHNYQTSGMTRSESKSQKIPHFDEMNIIATYHPPNKDYGHMKIEEPKTPYAPNDHIDEEMDTGMNNDEIMSSGFDPETLVQRLNESSMSTATAGASHFPINRSSRRSLGEISGISPEELEHRKQFEKHRKQHYNEFEVVRLRKQEIEAELRALEQEEVKESESEENPSNSMNTVSSNDSTRATLLRQSPRNFNTSSSHRVTIGNDPHDDSNERELTTEERERKKQFDFKRKQHYNEFRVAYLEDKED